MTSDRLGQTLRRVLLACLVWPAILILAACGGSGGDGGSNDNGDSGTNDNGGGSVPSGAARVYGRVLLTADETPLAVSSTPTTGTDWSTMWLRSFRIPVWK